MENSEKNVPEVDLHGCKKTWALIALMFYQLPMLAHDWYSEKSLKGKIRTLAGLCLTWPFYIISAIALSVWAYGEEILDALIGEDH